MGRQESFDEQIFVRLSDASRAERLYREQTGSQAEIVLGHRVRSYLPEWYVLYDRMNDHVLLCTEYNALLVARRGGPDDPCRATHWFRKDEVRKTEPVGDGSDDFTWVETCWRCGAERTLLSSTEYRRTMVLSIRMPQTI